MATVTKPIALDESFNTTETPSRNIADVLASLGDAISQGAQPATKKLATNSFKTLNGGLVDGLTIDFSPVQDLHGYSKPWAGGAGKNKLPLDLATIKSLNTSGTWSGDAYTYNDTTFTINTNDGGAVTSVVVSGTPSADAYLIVADLSTVASGSYTLSGCPMGGSASTYYQQVIKSPSPSITETGSGASFVIGGDYTVYNVRIVAKSGTTITGATFYPMIRLSSIADPTFEPYSNICPISGHTQAQSKINNTTYTTSLGGTYYGGDAEQVGGTGTQTLDVKSLASLSWSYQSAQTRFIAHIADMKDIASWNNIFILASCYPIGIPNAPNDKVIGVNANNIYIRNTDYTDPSDLITSLAGQTVCYELATPTTLTLTGQNITADVGTNNVSAPLTGQEIKPDSVIYKDMFTWEDVLKVI